MVGGSSLCIDGRISLSMEAMFPSNISRPFLASLAKCLILSQNFTTQVWNARRDRELEDDAIVPIVTTQHLAQPAILLLKPERASAAAVLEFCWMGSRRSAVAIAAGSKLIIAVACSLVSASPFATSFRAEAAR
jgi:hypothetical protein